MCLQETLEVMDLQLGLGLGLELGLGLQETLEVVDLWRHRSVRLTIVSVQVDTRHIASVGA